MEMGLGLGFRSLGLVSGKSCRKIIPRVFTVRAAKSLSYPGWELTFGGKWRMEGDMLFRLEAWKNGTITNSERRKWCKLGNKKYQIKMLRIRPAGFEPAT